MEPNTKMSLIVKAYKKGSGTDEQEIRICQLTRDVDFETLCTKLKELFPSLKNETMENFNLFWKDSENDMVVLSSDSEFQDAIMAMRMTDTQIFRVFIEDGVTLDRAAKPVVLVTGGNGDGDTWLYYVADKRWEEVPRCVMQVPSLCLTAEGRVLAAGGGDIAGTFYSTALCQVFDPRNKTWQPWPEMTTPRVGHALVRHGEKYLAVGGIDTERSSELYDPAMWCWRQVPVHLPEELSNAIAVKLRRDTWAFFDLCEDEETVLEFSFATEQWTKLAGGLAALPTCMPYLKLLTSVFVLRPAPVEYSAGTEEGSERQRSNIVELPQGACYINSAVQLSNNDVMAVDLFDTVYMFDWAASEWKEMEGTPRCLHAKSLVEVST